jgi:hypothetical protein
MVRNIIISYGEELLAPRPTPKIKDHPFSAVRDCLFNVSAATLHNWRPFLHPQPEDAPCRGDRDPLNMAHYVTPLAKIMISFEMSCLSPSHFYLFVHSKCRRFLWFHLITLKNTPHSVGFLWTRDRPVAETSTWQNKHCTRQISMLPVGSEPTIQASVPPKTYSLDPAATGFVSFEIFYLLFSW